MEIIRVKLKLDKPSVANVGGKINEFFSRKRFM